MIWPKSLVQLPDGTIREARAPLILSASRATDIPAFYSDWLLERLEAGWCEWTNPFNGRVSLIDLSAVRFIVFWSKHPAPLMPLLRHLDERGIGYYFNYTLNDYEGSNLEPGLPPLEERIACFCSLSEHLGAAQVIWRFDPLLLGNMLTIDKLLDRMSTLGERLHAHTRKLVFSFADINAYRSVARRLYNSGYRQFEAAEMLDFATQLAALNQKWKLQLATCAEEIDLSGLGIGHNSCIDGKLIKELAAADTILTGFFDQLATKKNLLAPGQRKACCCLPSKDIGQYSTCRYACAYCYACSRKKK